MGRVKAHLRPVVLAAATDRCKSCTVQGTGTQIDHKRELLLKEHVEFDAQCTISKAALLSVDELQHMLEQNASATG